MYLGGTVLRSKAVFFREDTALLRKTVPPTLILSQPQSSAIVQHGEVIVCAPAVVRPWLLPVADDVLFAVGAIVVVTAVLIWAMRSRRDPLACVPDRPHRLRPEGVAAPVLAWMLAGSTFVLLVDTFVGPDHREAAMIWAGNAAQLMGAAACLWSASRFFDGGVRAFLRGRAPIGRQIATGVAFFLASLALCPLVLELTVWALGRLDPDYHYFEHEIVEALRQGLAPIVTLWIGTALIAPVAEECFFRGIVQTYLQGLFRSRWVAVCATGTLFGAIHAGGGDSPQPHVVPALILLGIMLSVLYARTGSLIAPVILHALFNSKTLLWETLSRGEL